VRYVSPTLSRKPRRARISFTTWPTICSSRSESAIDRNIATASRTVMAVTSAIDFPWTVTARLSGFRRRPPQARHGTNERNPR
jgi:hypothetical protein